MNNRTAEIQRITLWGAVGNVALTIIKFVCGIVGGSAAMVADAVHSASDLISDIIVIVFARIAAQGHDKGHDYGHGKLPSASKSACAAPSATRCKSTSTSNRQKMRYESELQGWMKRK